MSINSKERFLAGLWDWAIFDGCFGQTKIHPTDVDGLVERNGCFLFLEAKPSGGELKTGQRITIESLSWQPRTWVIVFYGDPAALAVTRITLYRRGQPEDQPDPSLEALRKLVGCWYAGADRYGRVRQDG